MKPFSKYNYNEFYKMKELKYDEFIHLAKEQERGKNILLGITFIGLLLIVAIASCL